MKVLAASLISWQPTFRNPGFSLHIGDLEASAQLCAPDYAAFIPPMDRRRMSEVLKMAITCALDCYEQVGKIQPEGIIVGTSMGCCQHTKTFLDNILNSEGGLLSPTAFVLSTHNTIAGQISLQLKNNHYNITHTQNSLSLEHALIDAKMCLAEGKKLVLVGAADEWDDELYNIAARLDLPSVHSASGAAFFMLAPETEASGIRISGVEALSLLEDIKAPIQAFMAQQLLTPSDLDLVLYATSQPERSADLAHLFGAEKLLDYQKKAGVYFVNVAFALAFAIDRLENDANCRRMLICNNLIPENLGLILLEKN